MRKRLFILLLFVFTLTFFSPMVTKAAGDLCFLNPETGECVYPTTKTIVFDSNGGSSVSPITRGPGVSIILPTPVKSGYFFEGWYKDFSLTQKFTSTTMPNYDLTLYAKWTTNYFTITFNSNGGTSVSPISLPGGSSFTAPNPTKTGYKFDGWYSDVLLTQRFTSTTMPNNDITLYARWVGYTITFNSNGGSGVSPITLPGGSSFTAPNPTRTGYKFDGWYSDVSLTQRFTSTTMPYYDITLYAKWIGYTITFNSNGGSYESPITIPGGSAIIEPTPNKLGNFFKGWYLDEQLTQKFDFVTMPCNDFPVYAKWIFDTGGFSFYYSTEYFPETSGIQSYSLEIAGDSDFIMFYLNSDTQYLITSIGNTDVKGQLYNFSEQLLNTCDNDRENYDNNNNFKFEFKPSISGYYYLKVTGSNSSVSGDYKISVIDIKDLTFDYVEKTTTVNEIVFWSTTHNNPNTQEPETVSYQLTWQIYAEATVSLEVETKAIFAGAKFGASATVGASFTVTETRNFVIEAGTEKRLLFVYRLAQTTGVLNYKDNDGNIVYKRQVAAEWNFEFHSYSEFI